MINALIIDDNNADYELAKHYLSKHFSDMTFIYADSIDTYHDKMSWINPDVIICDYNLSGSYGIDILLDIKDRGIDVPFLFFTGMLNDELKATEAVLKGASAYVLKEQIKELPRIVEDVINEFNSKIEKRRSSLQVFDEIMLKLEKLQAIQQNDEAKELCEVLKQKLEVVRSNL